MRTLRASEIGSYLYCHRAWWYQKSGLPSENLAEMVEGDELHYRHGRAVLRIGCLRFAAYGLMIAGLVLVTLYLVSQWL